MFKTDVAAIFLVLFSPTILRNESITQNYWVVWNVGQGSWSTFVTESYCRHFDMGGEKNPLRRVARLCRGKNQRITLSHWDWDHVGFTLKAAQTLSQACLEIAPWGKGSAFKMKILSLFPPCHADARLVPSLRRLTRFSSSDFKLKSNDLSHVVIAADKILLPGDSSLRQEKIWSQNAFLKKVNFLLLGHHGSRTSTSEDLLRRLPELKTAVASARGARYGHPHHETIERLKKYHIPILKTEDWGNLWFEIRQ